MCDSSGQKLWTFRDVQYLRLQLWKPLLDICQPVTSLFLSCSIALGFLPVPECHTVPVPRLTSRQPEGESL